MIRRKNRSQSGFTLTEMMISVALLGMGIGFVVDLFLQTWQLWKRSYDELAMQRDARMAVGLMARTLREGSPGTVTIDAITGNPAYSRIAFTDSGGRRWKFWQNGNRIEYYGWSKMVNASYAITAQSGSTMFLATDVATLTFIYPNFQDSGLIEVAITCQKTPYARARPIVVQLVERVMIRNP